jgi:hypothetical protein
MADPQVFPLGGFVTGITRLRYKGGASPQSLYDLQNGYVDQSGMPTNRPGTTYNATLTAGTKGLCAFQGKLHVFALTAISVPTGYALDILIHPNPAFAGTLDHIYFAKPFLGFLYVVAGFSDGSVYHYWLQSVGAWKANTIYQANQNVQPTVANGFLYTPSSVSNPVAWAPNVLTSVGAVVQPTVYNGFQYTCIEADGANPSTGSIEPVWIAANGATVNDINDNAATPGAPTTTPSTGSPAGSRYDNLPGVKGV